VTRLPILTLLLFALAVPASALDLDYAAGLGMTAEVIDHDALRDDNFAGPAFVGTAAASDRVAARLVLYLWNHQDFTDADIKGAELAVLVGRGLSREGVRAYGLLGGYAEDYDSLDVGRDLTGVAVGLGVGYTWPRSVLDVWVTGRSNGVYEEILEVREEPSSYRTLCAGLSLSYRF